MCEEWVWIRVRRRGFKSSKYSLLIHKKVWQRITTSKGCEKKAALASFKVEGCPLVIAVNSDWHGCSKSVNTLKYFACSGVSIEPEQYNCKCVIKVNFLDRIYFLTITISVVRSLAVTNTMKSWRIWPFSVDVRGCVEASVRVSHPVLFSHSRPGTMTNDGPPHCRLPVSAPAWYLVTLRAAYLLNSCTQKQFCFLIAHPSTTVCIGFFARSWIRFPCINIRDCFHDTRS